MRREPYWLLFWESVPRILTSLKLKYLYWLLISMHEKKYQLLICVASESQKDLPTSELKAEPGLYRILCGAMLNRITDFWFGKMPPQRFTNFWFEVSWGYVYVLNGSSLYLFTNFWTGLPYWSKGDEIARCRERFTNFYCWKLGCWAFTDFWFGLVKIAKNEFTDFWCGLLTFKNSQRILEAGELTNFWFEGMSHALMQKYP